MAAKRKKRLTINSPELSRWKNWIILRQRIIAAQVGQETDTPKRPSKRHEKASSKAASVPSRTTTNK